MNHPQPLPKPWSIINQSILIYRTNFRLFLRLTLHSTAWFLVSNLLWVAGLGLFLVSPFALFIFFSQSSGMQLGHLLAIAILLLIAISGLSIFTSAKGYLYQALIGKVAYQILSGQPETVQVDVRDMRGRMWQFWYSAVSINSGVLLVNNITAKFEGGWMLLGITLQVLVAAQWFLSDLIIAVERCNVGTSLRRSRAQTKSYFLQVGFILVIIWLLIAPLYLLSFSPAIAVWQLEWQTPEATLSTGEPILHLIQALGFSLILFTLIQTFTIPLWQSTKASLYQAIKASSSVG
jgi:hypothetical protein